MALLRPKPRLYVDIKTEGQRDDATWRAYEMVIDNDNDGALLLHPPVTPQGYGSIHSIRIDADDLYEAIREAGLLP